MTPPPAEQFAARIFIGPALRAQPDRRLVDLVRDGYDAAFEEIVRRYRRPLDRFAAAFVGHRSEDVTQDSFSKALPALRNSEAEIELRPWLYRIVRNTALNELRDRATVATELSEKLPGGRGPAAEVEAREELRDLMERLQALPEAQRAALVMREFEGLSHEEIASALGVSGGAARQAIHRARAALREGFGLLMPLPALRALADHGGEAGAAGAGVALGGGAFKAGMATVLIAGAVGAGVAVEHHHGRGAGPEAAETAPVAGAKRGDAPGSAHAVANRSSLPADDSRGRSTKSDRSGEGRADSRDTSRRGSLGSGGRSGPNGSGSSGDGSRSGISTHSDSGSGGSGPGDVSGPGDRHGGRSGSGGGDGPRSGSGSDGGGSGSGDDGGTSGGSDGDDGLIDGDSSGSDGELESEPITGAETTLSDDSSGSGDSGSGGGGSSDVGETSGASGSGDLSGTDSTSGSDRSP